MRRLLVRLVAALELTGAVLLLVFAWQIPGSQDVEQATSRIETVSRQAGKQVRGLARQVRIVRQREPDLNKLARRLEKQMRSVSADVRSRSLSSDGLTTISEALGQVAQGLDGLSQTLAPAGVAQVGKGFSGMADYLDDKLLPTADNAAKALDKTTAGLKTDASKLTAAFKDTPLELKSARAAVDSLGRFEEGLQRMAKMVKVENFETIREGFKGLETSLDSGADQVERVSQYTIPKVKVKGLRLEIEEKDFWPEGKEIAAGMRKGAKGCQAAGKQMELVNKELPQLRKSLEQSQRVIRTTRQALALALAQQEKLEPVLRRLPERLALLAEELPRLTGELARVLRETRRLKDVAVALRQAEKGMLQASARWPQLREGLGKSASLLRATQKQMQGALVHREEYEQTLRQTVELTVMFAESLPVMLEEIETGLQRQETALDELGDSIDRVSQTLPEVGGSASRILLLTRWLMVLFAAALGLHAALMWSGGRAQTVVP